MVGPAERGAAQPPAEQWAVLDHVMAVVDEETATAVAESEVLARLGLLEVRTVESDGERWTGRYLVGRRDYLEVFGPGDAADAEPGHAGLGLATRARGDLQVIAERAAAAGALLATGQRTRELDGQLVPWFDHAEPGAPNGVLETWVMEFLTDPDDRERRGRAFAEWRTGRPAGTASLEAVTAVDLRVLAEDLDPAAGLLAAAGFTLETSPDLVLARDPGLTIRLEVAPGAGGATGVRRIAVTLDAPAPHEVHRLGRSTFTVGPAPEAQWVFD